MALLKRILSTMKASGPLARLYSRKNPLQPAETAPDSFVKAEQKAPVSRPAVAVGTTAAVIAVTEAAPAIIPPAVPDAITQGISNVGAWKGVGEIAWSFKDWALHQPTMAGVVLGFLCLRLCSGQRENRRDLGSHPSDVSKVGYEGWGLCCDPVGSGWFACV